MVVKRDRVTGNWRNYITRSCVVFYSSADNINPYPANVENRVSS